LVRLVVEGALRVVAGDQFSRNRWMHTRMASLYMDFCYIRFSWHANDYQKFIVLRIFFRMCLPCFVIF
jgi:hypothetical protein